MTFVTWALAAGSIAGLWLALPLEGGAPLERWLEPVFLPAHLRLSSLTPAAEAGVAWGAFAVAFAIAWLGAGIAFILWRDASLRERVAKMLGGFRIAAENKFYVDEAYQLLIVRPLGISARLLWRVLDQGLIDGVAVRGSAAVVQAFSRYALRPLQNGNAQSYGQHGDGAGDGRAALGDPAGPRMILTLTIFLPLAGAVLVGLLPRGEHGQLRAAALTFMLATFGLSLWVWGLFDPSATAPEFQLQAQAPWVPAIGFSYHVGVDGVALVLILLTTFLMSGRWRCSRLSSRSGIGSKSFVIALLLLETAMLGTLAALDLVLFYVFWEAMLIPMYLLIGIWGSERRIYAAVKFFIYTAVGSLLMLIAILYLYYATGGSGSRTFDIPAILAHAPWLTVGAQRWLFLAFALSFSGSRCRCFPLHTWLPDAHVEAPAAGVDHPGRCAAQDGDLRLPVRYAFPLFPGGRDTLPGCAGGSGGDRHRLRLVDVPGPVGSQEARRLFQRQPSWLRDAGPVCPDRRRRERRHLPDAQPRHLDRRALCAGGHSLRASAHPRRCPSTAGSPRASPPSRRCF